MSKQLILFEGFTIRGKDLPAPIHTCVSPNTDFLKNWKKIANTLTEPFGIIAISLGVDLLIKSKALDHPLCSYAIGIGARPHYPKHEIKLVKRMIINSYTNYLEHFYSNCFNEPLNESWQHYLSKRTLNYTKETLLNELELVENIALNESNLNHDKLYLVHGKNDRIAPLKEIQKLHLKRAITICPNQGHLDALNHIHDRRWLEEILSAK